MTGSIKSINDCNYSLYVIRNGDFINNFFTAKMSYLNPETHFEYHRKAISEAMTLIKLG